MTLIADFIIRPLFVLWAKTGTAHGLLYLAIEKMTGHFSNTTYNRTLYNNIVISCNLNDHVQQKIYFFGCYEPIDSSLFFSLIHKDNIVVDAGANIGFYSLMLAEKVGPSGSVHSFEPVPSTFSKLVNNKNLNPSFKNIYLNSQALWNKEESLHFSLETQNKNNIGAFSASTKKSSVEHVTCPTITLEQYFRTHSLTQLHAIKMDIEGAELAALEGAYPLIEKYKPLVLIEVYKKVCNDFGYSPNKLWEFFAKLDYKAYKIGNLAQNSSWVNDFSDIEQSNVLLIPSNKAHDLLTEWNDKLLRNKYLKYY